SGVRRRFDGGNFPDSTIAPSTTNAHAVFVPPPSIPRIFSSAMLSVAAVYDRRVEMYTQIHRRSSPPLQPSRAKSRDDRYETLHRPIVILSASEGAHLTPRRYTRHIGTCSTLCEVPHRLRGSG